jgi:hypothetical protein
MEPFDEQFNFTVPCPNVPSSPDSSPNAPVGGESENLGYGPDVASSLFTGGYLSRFNPPLSFWDSSVPAGITGVQQARCAFFNTKITLEDAIAFHAFALLEALPCVGPMAFLSGVSSYRLAL